jgi:methyl-accepting chemotaxis protein
MKFPASFVEVKELVIMKRIGIVFSFLVMLLAVAGGFGLFRQRPELFADIACLMAGGLLGTLLLALCWWLAFRRAIVTPLRTLGSEAAKLADGDLSFAVDVRRTDDIGRLQDAIKRGLRSVSGILRRVGEVTGRVAEAAGRVEKDSGQVAETTEKEATAIAAISDSVEELNASIREIAGNVEGLAVSVEDTAASVVAMEATITSVGAIVHDLSAGVEATSSSLVELSATIREVADGAGELADVSDSTLAAVEQIISSIGTIEQKVKESARLSERVAAESSSMGVVATDKTDRGMERIRTSVEKTAGALAVLDGRSVEIGKILTVIDDITEQTTLLALNATILAAQAGEKGRGFSVVADEMKALSGRTGVSTKEIAALIDAVRREVKTAVDSMHEALESVAEGTLLSREVAASFGTIQESARVSSEMSLSIERATGEQAQAAMLVSASVEKVRKMVHRMALATSEQSRGITMIMEATEKIRAASLHVRNASDQQAESSGLIAKAVEDISGRSQQIARAINEQKAETDQIHMAIEKIKDIPRQSKDIAFRVNRTLREVVKDVELIQYEMNNFRLHDEASDVLHFGIMPQEAPVVMYRRYAPLAQYLGDRLGRKVELRVAPNFETALRELGQGVTSLCSMTSMIYIEAQKKYGAQTMATVMRNGKAFHHSVIVTRAEGRIKTLQDLKGGSFAFVDEKAAAGYVIPRAMLLEAEVDLSDLAYHNFIGAHDEVARAVLRGEFDAGGLMESTACKYRDQGLVILAVSEQIPDWNICCRGLDPKVQQAVTEALLDLKETTSEDSAILKAIEAGCSGFILAADADHDGMRAMMTRISML